MLTVSIDRMHFLTYYNFFMCQFRIILVCFFFFCAHSANSQWKNEKVQVRLGEELKRSQQKGLQQMFGYQGGDWYTLQKKMTPFYQFASKQPYMYQLKHYNAEMKLVQAKKLCLKRNGKPLTYESTLQLGGALYLFSSAYEEGREKKRLFAQKINKQSLEPGNEFLQVAEIGKGEKGGHFSWKLSENGSKLLLLYTYFSGSRKTYNLKVFNSELEEVWSKKDCAPFSQGPYAIEQYEIDEEGNVYLLSTAFQDKRREKRQGAPDYAYYLTTYLQEGTAENKYRIRLPGKFLTDIRIKVNKAQDIIGGGFYAEEGSFNLEGNCFFTIDGASSEVLIKSIAPFDSSFVKEGAQQHFAGSRRRNDSVRLEKFGLRLNDILLREDGSALLLGEQFSIHAQSSLKKNLFGKIKISSVYEYNFSNLLVVSINRHGETEWARKIKKQQHSVNDGGLYASFRTKMVKGKLYTVFNNYFLTGPSTSGKLKELSPFTPMLVGLDREGEQSSSILPKLGEENLRLLPQVGMDAGDATLILLGAGKKKNRFIRLEIREGNLFSHLK